eukprot:1249765-Lingulodinium_polyedra.AAC.1
MRGERAARAWRIQPHWIARGLRPRLGSRPCEEGRDPVATLARNAAQVQQRQAREEARREHIKQ